MGSEMCIRDRRVLRVLLRALVRVCVDTCCVLGSPPTPGNPGTPPRCVCLYVYAGHDPDHRGEHGKNSWDVLKWDVLKSVGRKYEKGKLCVSVLRTVKSRRGKLVKYKAINELVRVGAIKLAK